MTDRPTPYLPPETIAAWERRIGEGRELADNPTRYLHRVGRQGLDNYLPVFEMSAEPAERFDELLYWRPLRHLMAYSLLRTPCRMSRPPDRLRDYDSPFVLVGTQTLPGGGLIRQDGRDHYYRHPRHLVMVHNNTEFVQRSETVADLAGVWVPIELLGRGLPDYAQMEPLVSDTVLARATAAFITGFANDVAVRQADISEEGELALAELVRAALAQHVGDDFAVSDSRLFVEEVTRQLIEQNYRDPAFSVAEIARLMRMSRRHLYRHFTEEQTPALLLSRRRLQHARELLERDGALGLEAVARAAGFASAATLRNRFRAEYGLTPTEYRNRLREEQGG